MASFRVLRNYRKGERLTADTVNEIVDICRMVSKITGSPPIEVKQGENGVQIRLASSVPILDLLELDEDIEAGNLDKAATKWIRNEGASSGDADQFHATTEALSRCMDHARSLWLEGTRALGLWLPNADQRILVPSFNWHVVEITSEEITSGGSGNAKVLTPISGSLADTDPLRTLVVNDIGTGTTTPGGARCVVLQHLVGGKWWIVPSLGQWAEVEGAVATVGDGGGPFTKSDADFKMKVSTVFGALVPGADEDDVITVHNRPGHLTAYMFEGEEEYSCHAFYDRKDSKWIARWVECP